MSVYKVIILTSRTTHWFRVVIISVIFKDCKAYKRSKEKKNLNLRNCVLKKNCSKVVFLKNDLHYLNTFPKIPLLIWRVLMLFIMSNSGVAPQG